MKNNLKYLRLPQVILYLAFLLCTSIASSGCTYTYDSKNTFDQNLTYLEYNKTPDGDNTQLDDPEESSKALLEKPLLLWGIQSPVYLSLFVFNLNTKQQHKPLIRAPPRN